MNRRARLLAAYLRQLGELGGPDLYLSTLSPAEALAATKRLTMVASGQPGASGATRRGSNRAVATVGPVASPAPATPHRQAARPSAPLSPALRVLAQEAAGCVRCRLHEGRRTVVFGEGDRAAQLVVVGEAPGGEEDRTGRPFVGPAGRLLDLLLLSAGFPRERVYICNILKCRPPGNRDPMADEVSACTTTFLRPQLEAIAPRALLAAGRHAAKFLFESDAPVGRLRGRVQSWRGIPVVATYHPAYLLRSPHMTRVAWEDVQLVRRILDE